jgi:hypothetical protein
MQLFPSWSDTLFRIAITVAIVGVLGTIGVLMLWVRAPEVTRVGEALDQPLAFDHRHHVRDDAIDCLYCHTTATRSRYAGVPATSLCMNCHAQVWRNAERLAPLRESYFSGRPIHWQRVHQLPGFAYFDHQAHTTHGVPCVRCHGRVDRMAVVYPTEPLTMEWCLGCHRDPVKGLVPEERLTDMEFVPPLEESTRVARALDVAPPLNCSACHR